LTGQLPQSIELPHPSPIVPQFFCWSAHEAGRHPLELLDEEELLLLLEDELEDEEPPLPPSPPAPAPPVSAPPAPAAPVELDELEEELEVMKMSPPAPSPPAPLWNPVENSEPPQPARTRVRAMRLMCCLSP
jgi:hypothetical protein